MKLNRLTLPCLAGIVCLGLLGCRGLPGSKIIVDHTALRDQPAAATLPAIQDMLAMSQPELDQCLCQALRPKGERDERGYKRALLQFYPHFAASLRGCLRHPDPSFRLSAALLICQSGHQLDREFLLQNLDSCFPEFDSIHRSLAVAALASGMSVNPGEAEMSHFAQWIQPGIEYKPWAFWRMDAALMSLIFDGSTKAKEVLLNGLEQSNTRGDLRSARTLQDAFGLCKKLGEPQLSGNLDESLLLLERYCERSGRRLKVEEIALNPANDAAFVWLAGADAVAQRHPSEYVATFRLFEGVWKLVYFRQTRVS